MFEFFQRIKPGEFWFYYASILILALVLFTRRRQQRSMRLRLGGSTSQSGRGRLATQNQERVLNVVFNYNGHSWDAHEVLGIPAGSSFDKVKAAYQASLAKVEADSHAFLEAAYQAIQKHSQN